MLVQGNMVEATLLPYKECNTLTNLEYFSGNSPSESACHDHNPYKWPLTLQKREGDPLAKGVIPEVHPKN